MAIRYYCFGPFRLGIQERILFKGKEEVSIGLMGIDVLELLIKNRGHIVTRSKFLEEVWKSHPDADQEGSLNFQIFEIRQALEDDVKKPKYIKTERSRGYKFIAEVFEEKSTTTIAVLPFNSLVSGEDDQHLGYGIANSLIMKLSSLSQLVVRRGDEISKYTGFDRNPIRVGHELNVDLVLDGKLQRDAGRIRVIVQLLRIQDNKSLWGDYFDEDFTVLFTVMDSISQRVAEQLIPKLSPEEERPLVEHPTRNSGALDAYWGGLYHYEKRTPEGLLKGIDFFKQATDLDPNFALAYVKLAEANNLLGYYSVRTPKEAMPEAKKAIEKALELDDSLAEAHTALAVIKHSFDWDWTGAEEEFKRAIKLTPKYATAYHKYGWLLIRNGKIEEAIAMIAQAQEIVPNSFIIATRVGTFFYFNKQYNEAIKRCQKVLEKEPGYLQALLYLGMSYEQIGLDEKAITTLNRAVKISGNDIEMLAALGHAYATGGRIGEALKVLDKLEKLAQRGSFISPYYIANIYAGLREPDKAFDWLEVSYQAREEWITYLNVNPAMSTLRPDARFADLIKRIGL